MDVEVHHVEAHVAHTHLAQDGVHVGAVVVQQGIFAAQHFHDARQMQLQQAQGVGVGHHQTGHLVGILGHGFFKGGGVHHAVTRRHVDDLEARQHGRGGVGAVGRVGDEHLGAVAALGLVVGGNELDAGIFAVGPGHGLEGEGLHARDLAQPPFGIIQALQGTLGQFAGKLGQQGMHAGKARQGGHVFRELGVVLHGAGAKGIEIGIHAVVELGQIGEVAHHVQLGALGQARRALAQQGFGQHLRGAGRVVVHRQGQTGSAAAFYGFGKDGFHSRPPSFSTMASTCARVLHSVQASKSTSSMPA